MAKKLKNIQVVTEDLYGVCLWQMSDGACLGDDEGRMLSLEGHMSDPKVEGRMRDSAVSYLGSEALLGKPLWMSGSRKLTDNEHDDQMERMIDGYIPDPVDSVKQLLRGGAV